MLPLLRRQRLPLLADRLAEIRLPLLPACCRRWIHSRSRTSSEEDERVLRALDVIVVALLGTTLEHLTGSG